jgi:hypothetical protein
MLPALLVALNHLRVYVFKLIKGSKLAMEAVEPAVREDIFASEQSDGVCEEG